MPKQGEACFSKGSTTLSFTL